MHSHIFTKNQRREGETWMRAISAVAVYFSVTMIMMLCTVFLVYTLLMRVIYRIQKLISTTHTLLGSQMGRVFFSVCESVCEH